MRYFDSSFHSFFEGLAANNTKEWFDSQRNIYEKSIKKPFVKLVEDLMKKVSEFDNNLPVSAQKAIFRINRDIRFSKDKSPYKTHVAAFLSSQSKNPDFAGYYFMLSAKGLELGGGLYQPTKEAIDKVRSEILYHTLEFSTIIESEEFVKKYGSLQGEKNKIIASQYKELIDNQPFILNKQFFYWAELDDRDLIVSDNLVDLIASYFKAGYAMNNFLRRAVES